jgi:hypothetical protein
MQSAMSRAAKNLTGRQRSEADGLQRREQPANGRASVREAVLALQRSAGNGAVGRLVGGGGTPLEARTRAEMEARLGHNLSSVRVHDDASAALLARSEGALALTSGRHVYFGAGAYAPDADEGKALLAHELAHVVQQRPGSRVSHSPTAKLEAEAQRVADTPGRAAITPGSAPPGAIQRADKAPDVTVTKIAPEAKAPELPPAVVEARKLQARAQQLQQHLPSRSRDKAVGSTAEADYVSGTKPQGEFAHISADEVARHAGKIGHEPQPGGYLDPTRTGEAADVHVEPKMITDQPGVPKAVAKPMCEPCQRMAKQQAISSGQPEVIDDPVMTREFKPSGDVVEWHHDGRVVTHSETSSSASPGPAQSPTAFRRQAPPTASPAQAPPVAEQVAAPVPEKVAPVAAPQKVAPVAEQVPKAPATETKVPAEPVELHGGLGGVKPTSGGGGLGTLLDRVGPTVDQGVFAVQVLSAVSRRLDEWRMAQQLHSEWVSLPARTRSLESEVDKLRDADPKATIYANISFRFKWGIPTQIAEGVPLGFATQVFQEVKLVEVRASTLPLHMVSSSIKDEVAYLKQQRTDLATYSVPLAQPGEHWQPRMELIPAQAGDEPLRRVMFEFGTMTPD